MPLVTTIEQVRANGVNVNYTNSDSNIADMQAAEDKFLLPILGDTLFEAMVAAVNDNSSDLQPLIKKAQRAEAALAYWLDLPNIQTQIADRGIATASSANMETAHRWEFEQLRESLADKGCWALDTMLQHLYENKTTYSWNVPGNYKFIFLTGIDFNNYFPIFQPYRTFESLRPVVKLVEDQYIRASIGDTFFQQLRDASTPDTNQKTAIDIIKKSVAHLTIYKATEILPVKISSGGFTVSLTDAFDAVDPKAQQAPGNQMSLLHDSSQETGETYLMQLQEFLNNTATNSIFSTYYNSIYYKAPSDDEDVSPNEDRAIFSL